MGNIGDIYKNIKGRWSNNFSNALYGIKQMQKLRVLPVGLEKYGVSLEGVFAPGGKQGKWLECVSLSENSIYDKLQMTRYDISMSFFSLCIPIIETAMLEKGNLTFFDYLYYLRNMLRKDAGKEGKLIQYIYDRHSYFLIDEFQDTNPMQAEVFFYLAAEKPVENWRECVPKPGSLFIVGDPKQSIYRFRSADVTSFLNVKKLFEKNNGTVAHLTRNFRSTSALCGYFNRVFSDMLPDETDNQSKFEEIPIPAQETDDVFQGVYTYKAYTGKAAEAEPEMADPVRIADIIERLVGRDDYLIKGSNDKGSRPIRYSDFMVITSAKAKLAPIMAELDERGIPTRVEGNVPFEKNEALQEIYKVYAAIAGPNDIMALYGAMNGKILGLSKTEIASFKADGGYISTKDIDVEKYSGSAKNVAEILNELAVLQKDAMRLSPAALFAQVLDRFQVYRKVAAENLEVIYYTLELLRNAERTGMIVTLEDGSNYLSKLAGGESEEERCLSLNEGTDCVHMANLHKVKGLEAPIVILAASSARGGGGVSMRVVHGEQSTEGYLFALEGERRENARSTPYFETNAFADEKQDEKDASDAEGLRLIYVAATRARNVLIISNSFYTSRGSEVNDCKWKPIIESGTPDIFDSVSEGPMRNNVEVETVVADDLYEDAKKSCAFNERDAESQTYSVESPSKLAIKSKLADVDIADNLVIDALEAEKAAGDKKSDRNKVPAALLGSMAHKFMEMLVSSRNQMNVAEAITEIIREYRTHENEKYEKAITERLSKMADAIRNGGYDQSNGAPKDILNTLLSADEVYCEVPFSYKDEADGTTIWNGIMDTVYCKDGNWHILDYKTNADGTNLDEKYSGQLKAYISAFKETTGQNADALIYHLDV